MMKNLNLRIFLFAILAAAPVIVSAQTPLTYYRDAQGIVSQASESNANTMLDIAKQNGHITLWLVLNYEFNIDSESMTAAEQEAQTAEVTAGFAEILDPMIRNGHAWLPSAGLTVTGPGTKVRATKNGLKKLLRDSRILQLSAIE